MSSSSSCRAATTDFPDSPPLSLSLTIRLYHSSLPAGPLDFILYLYRFISRPTLARPCEGVHRRSSLMSSFLLLQLCPAYLVLHIWIVLEMGDRWPYNCYFMGCRLQVLFDMTRCILVLFPASFFFIHLVSVHVVHPYTRINTIAAGKKLRFILSDMFDFHMIDNLLILFTNPSARAGYDTRSIFKRSLTGLNSEFSFS